MLRDVTYFVKIEWKVVYIYNKELRHSRRITAVFKPMQCMHNLMENFNCKLPPYMHFMNMNDPEI